MNIKFLQRKPRFQTLAFTALASLAACSSSPDETAEGGEEDQALMDPASDGGDASASTDSEFDLGEGASDSSADMAADSSSGGSQASNGTDPYYGQRRAPEVQRTPFQSDGRWMNAFYVVRSGSENWESLSQLIYGRPDRADMIAKWNQEGTLKVGRVVYYNSAIRPEDSAGMKVLAEDFNLAMEKVEVQAGDSLSAIGARLYGDAQTWKEIAALNPEITSPDIIQPGQTLTVQPAQLNTTGVLDQVVAQAGAMPSTNTAQVTDPNALPNTGADQAGEAALPGDPLAQNGQADATATPAQPDNVDAPATQGTVGSPTLPNSSGGMNTGMLSKLGIGLFFLCLVGLLIRRWLANKKARDDWSADQLNVTKLSRPGN